MDDFISKTKEELLKIQLNLIKIIPHEKDENLPRIYSEINRIHLEIELFDYKNTQERINYLCHQKQKFEIINSKLNKLKK